MEVLTDLYKGTIIIKERKTAEIDNVESIASFDDEFLELVTKWGNIIVTGNNMTIISLDKAGGRITVEGRIREVSFDEKTEKKRGRRLG